MNEIFNVEFFGIDGIFVLPIRRAIGCNRGGRISYSDELSANSSSRLWRLFLPKTIGVWQLLTVVEGNFLERVVNRWDGLRVLVLGNQYK